MIPCGEEEDKGSAATIGLLAFNCIAPLFCNGLQRDIPG